MARRAQPFCDLAVHQDGRAKGILNLANRMHRTRAAVAPSRQGGMLAGPEPGTGTEPVTRSEF